MLDEFFILYPNNSFISDPFNLLIICDEIHSSIHKRYKDFLSFHIPIFNDIIKLTEFNDPEKGRAYTDEMIRLCGKEDFTGYFATSYEAVYGYRNGYCEHDYWGCRVSNSIDTKALLKEHDLPSDIQLKCYQCNQLRFTSLLSRLVRGEYENLISSYFTLCEDRAKGIKTKLTPFLRCSIYLYRLFDFAYRPIVTELTMSNDGKLKKSSFLSPIHLSSDNSVYKVKTRVNDYINSVLGFSLSEFITKNDLRKLKYCIECKEFFISKTIRPSKFCSDKCRQSWHNRKRIESGEHAKYKRKKRMEGAKESYYG